MSTEKNPAPKLEESRNQIAHWSSDAGLSVTVISTTEKGTVASLRAAKCLAADLDATITLLKMEIVPARFPLYRPPVSLKYTINRQRSIVRQSSVNEADVDLKIRFCRDWSSGLQWVLRRRSLIVIAGKRHWWVSREERLERVLRALGHHVIFIDRAQEEESTSHGSKLSHSFGKSEGHFHKQKQAARFVSGAKARGENIL
jgi:hypothetical protein